MAARAMSAASGRASLAIHLLALRASGFVPGGVVSSPHARLPPWTPAKMASVPPDVPPRPWLPLATGPPMERAWRVPQGEGGPAEFHQPVPLVPWAAGELTPVQLQDSAPPANLVDPEPLDPLLPSIPEFPGRPGERASPGLDVKLELPAVDAKASATLRQWSKDAAAAQRVSIDRGDEKTWKFWNGAQLTLELMKIDLKEGNPDTVLAIADTETDEIKAIANVATTEIFDILTNQMSKVVYVGYIAADPKSDVGEELGVELYRRINYWGVAGGRSVVFFAAIQDTKDYYRNSGFDLGKEDFNGLTQVLYTEPQNANGRKYKLVELQLDTAKILSGIGVGSG